MGRFYDQLVDKYECSPVLAWGFGRPSEKSYSRMDDFIEGKKLNLGKDGDQFWFDGDDAYSYRTKIAEKQGKTFYLNTYEYSKTTNEIQYYLRAEAKKAGFKIVEKKDARWGEESSFSLEHGPEA